MLFHLKERWHAYAEPWLPLSHAFLYLLQSLPKGLRGSRSRAFAKWYSSLGHHFAAFEAEHTPVPRLVGKASGIVVELGPGSGNQFPRFHRSEITRIYGIEPNEELFHRSQDETIEQHGLSATYVPIHASLEDDGLLASLGIGKGSVDTVVCMQVLCSVPDPFEAAKHIHRLLKPGGQLLFWEHQRNKDKVTGLAQWCWDLLWSPLIGGCSLRGDIELALVKAGDWDVVELGYDDQQPWNLMPRVWDHFVKSQTNR